MTDKTPSPWRTVDLTTLTPAQKTAFDAFTAANKLAGKAREAFEALYLKGAVAPEGHEIKLGYRFGLGIAIVPKGGKVKGGKAKVSLASYLEAQAA